MTRRLPSLPNARGNLERRISRSEPRRCSTLLARLGPFNIFQPSSSYMKIMKIWNGYGNALRPSQNNLKQSKAIYSISSLKQKLKNISEISRPRRWRFNFKTSTLAWRRFFARRLRFPVFFFLIFSTYLRTSTTRRWRQICTWSLEALTCPAPKTRPHGGDHMSNWWTAKAISYRFTEYASTSIYFYLITYNISCNYL